MKKRRKIVEKKPVVPVSVAEEVADNVGELEAKVKVLAETEGESTNEVAVDSPVRISNPDPDSQQG